MTTFLVIAFSLAFLAAIVLVLTMIVGYRVTVALPAPFVMGTFLSLVGFGSVAVIALSTRNWNAASVGAEYYSLTTASVWISRLISAAVVALALVEVLKNVGRLLKEQLRPAFALWLCFALFFLATVLSAFLGTKPDFQHKSLYAALVLTAVYLQPAVNPETVARVAKGVIAMMLAASVLAVAVSPDAVLEHNYRSLLPGVKFRFHGLAIHANSIAPLALIYLVLEYWVPSRRAIKAIGSVLALIVLVLAQSKTAWVAAILVLAYLYGSRALGEIRRAKGDALSQRGVLLAASPVLFVPSILLLMLLVLQPLNDIDRFLRLRIPGWSTLTGRDVIWEITLREWQANPWFGYGPTLWDPEFRLAHGLLFAGHAHNQLFQTLGEAGVIGLTAFLLYVGVLTAYSFRHSGRTKGVTVALLTVLLLRCVTEAPFRTAVFLEPAFLAHLLLFGLLVMLEKQRHDSLPDGARQ
jgi:O-antigen ligase